jgi:hypothetical protein
MPASQDFGFIMDNEIVTKVFQAPKGSYTSIHDVPKDHNPFDRTENVSIKSVSDKGVPCMGSALRIWDYDTSEKHTAIIVTYVQRGGSKVVTRVVEFSLDDKVALFGTLAREDIVRLDALIRSVPPGQISREMHAQVHNLKKELNAKSGLVKFNPKIDSNTQRRLQCSLPKVSSLVAAAPKLIQSDVSEAIVRGVPILASAESGTRVRNARM